MNISTLKSNAKSDCFDGRPLFVIKGINEDVFGYDYNNYEWIGAKEISPGRLSVVRIIGEDAIKAQTAAAHNGRVVPEDCVSTGDIAIGMSPALGTVPQRAKKKKNKVLLGDKK